jgi:hypothetical protein
MGIHENYYRLNEAANKIFFSERNSLKPIYIDIEDNIAAELSDELSIPQDTFADFLGNAVKQTLSNTGDPYEHHLNTLERWERLKSNDMPPFTALLCVLSMAAENMCAEDGLSSANYYVRLAEILKCPDFHQRLSTNGTSASKFWKALNKWLRDADYEFGIPTAEVFDSRKHIGYAISQALVREGDRQKLHKMFASHDFVAGQKMLFQEMEASISYWMCGSGPSPWLKKIWNNKATKDRLVQSAMFELTQWSGNDENTPDGQFERSLSWIAKIKNFPPSLRLHLGADLNEGDHNEDLVLDDDSSSEARVAFAKCEGRPWLSTASEESFATLEPKANIDISHLLMSSFFLAQPDGEGRFKRKPRVIIPLMWSSFDGYYREVSRVVQGQKHIILCASAKESQVRRHVEAYARPNFKLPVSKYKGLPAGWSLFRDVEFAQVEEDVSKDLVVLTPLGNGISITCDGGMPLAPSVWHGAAPPSIHVVSGNPVTVTITNVGDSSDGDLLLSEDFAAGDFTIENYPAAGELDVVVKEEKLAAVTQKIILRNAETPRPLYAGKQQNIAYQFDDRETSNLYGASLIDDEGANPGTYVSGGNVVVDDLMFPDLADSQPIEPADELSVGELEDDFFAPEYLQSEVSNVGENCALRGCCYWRVEDTMSGTKNNKFWNMECKECGAVQIQQVYKRKRDGGRSQARNGKSTRSRAKSWNSPIVDKEPSFDADLCFDALCYSGGGRWKRFRELIASQSESTFAPTQFARNTIELCHVDLMFDAEKNRPKTWKISNPTVVFPSEGRAFYAGFRNQSIRQELCERFLESGAVTEFTKSEMSPEILAWQNVDIEKIVHLLQGVKDSHGRSVEISINPAKKLSRIIANLRLGIEKFPELRSFSDVDLEMFDIDMCKWLKTEQVVRRNAYRTTFGGRHYFYVDDEGIYREADYGTVKTLAARSQGRMLHGYDELSRTFTSTLGAEPSGLLGRALTMCTGSPAVIENGLSIYGDVPKGVAFSVLRYMYK